ncbi:MAG TPA: HAD family hydrolase [Candidatus Saccharimonadales bacterium]|nr:HAD family hydrolase [Candidatus Saccharimonadales bacterium]
MRLVIFDIDGTLTDTVAVDARCFLQTFEDICGFKDVDPDWSGYANATDAGIYHEIFATRIGRAPTVAETEQFQRHLVGLFRAAAQARPFAPVPGAPQLLARLRQSADFQVALATGCWAEPARVKMTGAGMNYDDYPSASADDAPERESIIKLALARATRLKDAEGRQAVYVGDGVWDARACRKVGIPFLGIAAGAQREKLLAAGAAQILPDFSDQSRFFAAIETILAI